MLTLIKNTEMRQDIQDVIYRDNLARLQERSNGKEVLNLRETAMMLGFKDIRTVKKLYPFVNGYISLATLARCLTPVEKEAGESWQERICAEG